MGRGLLFQCQLPWRGRLSRQGPKTPPTYAVLAILSDCYPPLKGRLPTCYAPVRHFTRGRSPFLVRLACVRPAANVRSEPGSNSPVFQNCRVSKRSRSCDPRRDVTALRTSYPLFFAIQFSETDNLQLLARLQFLAGQERCSLHHPTRPSTVFLQSGYQPRGLLLRSFVPPRERSCTRGGYPCQRVFFSETLAATAAR